MRMLWLFSLTFVFCSGCVEIDFEAPEIEENIEIGGELSSYVGTEDLISIINNGDVDRIVAALNTIKMMQQKNEQLSLIYELWDEKSAYGITNTKVLDQEVVQAEFADVLIQAVHNNQIQVDKDKLHSRVLSHVSSQDPQVRRVSIGSLGIFDRCADVHKLKGIALKEDPGTFRSSALALTQMCCGDAKKALMEIERDVVEPDNHSFLNELLNSSDQLALNAALCAGSERK